MTNPDIAKAVERLEAYVEYLESDSFRLDMEPDDAPSLAEEIRALIADHARLTKLVSPLLEADRGQGWEAWRPIEEAPRDGTHIILAWKEVPGLAQHNELGRWRNGWANTYGQPFLTIGGLFPPRLSLLGRTRARRRPKATAECPWS